MAAARTSRIIANYLFAHYLGVMFSKDIMKFKLTTSIILATTLLACNSTPKSNSWNDELKIAANELNSGLPMMVDSETRLDSTIALMNTFTYRYTMINHSVEDVNVQQFTDIMTKQIFNTVCTSPDMTSFVQNKTEVNYIYVDKDSKHLSKISVDTNECTKT